MGAQPPYGGATNSVSLRGQRLLKAAQSYRRSRGLALRCSLEDADIGALELTDFALGAHGPELRQVAVIYAALFHVSGAT